MNRTAIGVWLLVALVSIVLYLLPEAMKQLFFVKEQFVSAMREEKDAWKFAATEAYVDVPKAAAKPAQDMVTPDYLQNVPADFEVGAAGNKVAESQPATIDGGVGDMTPMIKQGVQAQRTVKAPAAKGAVEGFQGSTAPAPATGAPADAKASVCGYEYNPDPTGQPVYTCDGKITTPPVTNPPPKPRWLNTTTTRDGIDTEEAAILNWWLANDNRNVPGWVQQLMNAETITPSEKKAFSAWAAENTKAGNAIVKPTTFYTSNTATSCKPKPKCKPKKADAVVSTETTTCKGPIDMGNYIRKDSIPCWACTL